MDAPTNLLQFVVWDRLPFALAVVVIAFIGGRIAARSLDALGERINKRRLLFKQVSAITRFLVLIVATVLVASSLFSFSSEALLAVGGSAAVAAPRHAALLRAVVGVSTDRPARSTKYHLRQPNSPLAEQHQGHKRQQGPQPPRHDCRALLLVRAEKHHGRAPRRSHSPQAEKQQRHEASPRQHHDHQRASPGRPRIFLSRC